MLTQNDGKLLDTDNQKKKIKI